MAALQCCHLITTISGLSMALHILAHTVLADACAPSTHSLLAATPCNIPHDSAIVLLPNSTSLDTLPARVATAPRTLPTPPATPLTARSLGTRHRCATLLTSRPASCSPVPPPSTPFQLASQLRLNAPNASRNARPHCRCPTHLHPPPSPSTYLYLPVLVNVYCTGERSSYHLRLGWVGWVGSGRPGPGTQHRVAGCETVSHVL